MGSQKYCGLSFGICCCSIDYCFVFLFLFVDSKRWIKGRIQRMGWKKHAEVTLLFCGLKRKGRFTLNDLCPLLLYFWQNTVQVCWQKHCLPCQWRFHSFLAIPSGGVWRWRWGHWLHAYTRSKLLFSVLLIFTCLIFHYTLIYSLKSQFPTNIHI